jgi:hypothetical protein
MKLMRQRLLFITQQYDLVNNVFKRSGAPSERQASLREEANPMSADKLEVVAIDVYSGRVFILYFSDETYVEISGEDLADHFSRRSPIPFGDRRPLHGGLICWR